MPQEYLPLVNLKSQWLSPPRRFRRRYRASHHPPNRRAWQIDFVKQANSTTTEGNVEFSLQFEDISRGIRAPKSERQAIDRVDLPKTLWTPSTSKSNHQIHPTGANCSDRRRRADYHQLRQRADDLRDLIEDFWEIDRVFLDDRERQVHVEVDLLKLARSTVMI